MRATPDDMRTRRPVPFPKQSQARKAIQIVATPSSNGDPDLYALCNDGTMWGLNHGGQWIELPPIQQGESEDPLAVATDRIERAMEYSSAVIRSNINRSGSLVALNVNTILRGSDEACQARQHSDQMVCEKCSLAWDMNDPAPPSCTIVASVKG